MTEKVAHSFTEEEWFSTENYTWLIMVAEQLPVARRATGRRKFRLLTCAYCRRIWHLIEDAEQAEVVEIAERFAEGTTTAQELADGYKRMRTAMAGIGGHRATIGEAVRGAAEKKASDGTRRACGVVAYLLSDSHLPSDRDIEQLKAQCAVEEAAHCNMLRHVFGDPFRPVSPDSSWLTPTVVSLAQTAYDERHLPSGELDAHRLAVLADALEEVGAADELMAHLRGPGPHVRGCHVVDLCLGLS